MKTKYLLLFFILTSVLTFSQGYEFALVNTSGYNFKVIAIPNFDSTGNTDVSNIGFTLMLPAGSADAINQINLLVNGAWSVDQYNAATLSGAGAGDGTRDAFLFTLPPGQNLLSHTSGVPIDLVSFEVSNNPVAGVIEFLPNNDPINTAVGNALSSFYQSNIDATTTQDYFLGIEPTQSNFMFLVLAVDDNDYTLVYNPILYPNPASDIVSIKTSSYIKIKKIEMVDVLGKKFKLKLSDNQSFNISKYSTGLYSIIITTRNDKVTKKLIIK